MFPCIVPFRKFINLLYGTKLAIKLENIRNIMEAKMKNKVLALAKENS